jgi:hypothetical protein
MARNAEAPDLIRRDNWFAAFGHLTSLTHSRSEIELPLRHLFHVGADVWLLFGERWSGERFSQLTNRALPA